MDLFKTQILKKIDYLSRSTKNFQWYLKLLVENGILRSYGLSDVNQERDPVAKMRNLYLALLNKRVQIDVQVFLGILTQCQNEHLLQCFTTKAQKAIFAGSDDAFALNRKGIYQSQISPKSAVPPQSKFTPTPKHCDSSSTWKPTQLQQNQRPLDDDEVYFCISGRPQALENLENLNFPPTLTTIKLKYVSLPWSSLSCLNSCPNLEFLQLDKVKLLGDRVTAPSKRPIFLPKLEEFYFNQLKDLNTFQSSLEEIKKLNYDWESFLFFNVSRKFTIWDFDNIFKHRLTIDVQISGRHLIVVNFIKRKFLLHSNFRRKFSEIFSYFESDNKNRNEGIPKIPFPFENIALSGVVLDCWANTRQTCRNYVHVTQLNLSQVDISDLDFSRALKSFPSLRRLAVTSSPNLGVDMSSIPRDLKSLALNVGSLRMPAHGSLQQMELDSLCIFDTRLGDGLLQNFTKIFKCSRVGLGGNLNANGEICGGSDRIVSLIKLLLTTQYETLDWLFLWGLKWVGVGEWDQQGQLPRSDRDMLEILGVDVSAIENSGLPFEFEPKNQQLVGRGVGDKEGDGYVQDLLGFTDFYQPI